MPTFEELKLVREQKVQRLLSMGLDPYPADVARTHAIQVAREQKTDAPVVVCGRVMAMRGQGKISFVDLRDGTGQVQVVVKKDLIDAKSLEIYGLVDVGDFIEVGGAMGQTQSGEISVFATALRIVTKSVRPLPDTWHGLKDIEERYRQRYVDLVVNPGVRDIFLLRTKVIKFIRKFLDDHDFVEVETPALQPIYGGASAMPFETHHNALDTQMFLRISDELYLKRLIVGGFDRVYEISKDFRNEGVDRQHNPEFTMLEYYWAYANYDQLMHFTEDMISQLVVQVCGSTKITYQGQEIDFKAPWPRKSYREVVLVYAGIDIDKARDESALLSAIAEKKIKIDLAGVLGYGAILDTLYKATARPHLVGPMFLTDRPTAFVTLAKRLPNDPDKTASFQLLVAGKEVINAYNELNDPADQARRWRQSEELGEKGQEEHEAFDHDYIRALEYGMPPTAGFGMGIDRLVSLLTDQPNIKDVILFPTLKPEFAPIKTQKKSSQEVEVPLSQMVSVEKARELVDEHITNVNLRRHCYAVGYAMRALAVELGGNPTVWHALGTLHDADWEECKDTPEEHTKKTLSWLVNDGVVDGPIVRALKSHNRKHTNLAEIEGVMEWALETCDELTGFIVAVALIRPEKSLASVTVEAVLKKFKAKEFAKAVDREQIAQCHEKLGIELEKFVGIVLSAMQGEAQDLGL